MSTNPFSTGGGGFNFEHCVQALTLIDLVYGSSTRVFPSCPVQRVEFQTNRLGYETDDMLVQGIDPSIGKSRRLLYQIKRRITFLESNEEWVKCIGDFWKDFNNADLFDCDCDAFVVAVSGLSNADDHFANVLEKLRLGNAQTMAKGDRSRYEGVWSILRRLNNEEVSETEFNRFLKCIHVVQYGELDTWESISIDSRVRANRDLWNEAIEIASRTDSQGASYDLLNLQPSLIHKAGINMATGSMMVLRDHSDRLMARINDSIAGQYVDRKEKAKEFDTALSNSRVVFVVGDAGTGKSVLVKHHLMGESNTAIVWLTSEDLNRGSLEEAAHSLGIQESLRAVANQLSLNRQVAVVVDSMERLVQGSDVTCLNDLINVCCARNWHFIGILRSYSFRWLPDRLGLTEKSACQVALDVFSGQELAALDAIGSTLDRLSLAAGESRFFRNPYNLSMLAHALKKGGDIDVTENPISLRRSLWDLIVERIEDRSPLNSRERGEAFESICVKRASTLVHAVSCKEYDKAVIDDLCSTNLLKHVSGDDYTVSHDVLEDWGVFHHLDKWYSSQSPSNSNAEFLAHFRDQPGMGRAFATWLGERITSDASTLAFIKDLITDPAIDNPVRRFCITAAIESGQLGALLDSFDYGLFGPENSVFALVVSTLRLCAVKVKPTLGVQDELYEDPRAPVSFVPHGHVWDQVFSFALRHVGSLDRKSCREVVGALKEWSITIVQEDADASAMRTAGLLALRLLEKGYGHDRDDWLTTTLASVATRCFPAIEDEYRKALQLGLRHNELNAVARELRADAVFGMGSDSLVANEPRLLATLVRLEFYAEEPQKCSAYSLYEYEDPFSNAHYGLRSNLPRNHMAHGRRPPFFGLFRHAPMVAAELCVEICNHIGTVLAKHPANERDVTAVSVLNGTHPEDGYRTVQVSSNMWCAYRGMGTIPSHIQSMLMSLENCLIGLAESNSERAQELFLRMYDYVLLKGETALTLGVAASLAAGFPSIVGAHCLPLFSAPELYFEDAHRRSQEAFGSVTTPYTYEDEALFRIDRIPSNGLSWRQNDLEQLCVRLQLCGEYRAEILSMVESFPEDDLWLKALKTKLDTTRFSVVPGEEPGTVALTPPTVDLGEEIKLWLENYEKSTLLYDWGRKTFDDNVPADNAVGGLFQVARDLAKAEDEQAFRGINMFCAAVVRAGLLNSGPSEMHDWCCDWLLSSCENALDGFVDEAKSDVVLSSLDCCFEVAPLLLRDEAVAVRNRARQLISKGFMGRLKSIAVPAARGIAAYLWDIDDSFARELLDGRNHASRELDQVDRGSGVRYGGDDRTILLTACPASHDTSVREMVTTLFSDAIAADECERDYYEGRRRYRGAIANDVGKDGPAGLLAKYLFELGSIEEFATLLKKGAKDAPTFIRSILVYLAGRAAGAGEHTCRWRLVEVIKDELVEIALESPNDTSSPRAGLLIKALCGDANWQPLDYEQENVRYGKGVVLDIASRARGNAAVFSSLTRLMYHFPKVFSVECMDIVNGVDSRRIEELFDQTSDAMFCLVAWLRTFVLQKKDAVITRAQYECCLRVLDIAIETGSREAHYVRDSFINKRWRFARG